LVAIFLNGFSGTPGDDSAETFGVTVTATDNDGATAEYTT